MGTAKVMLAPPFLMFFGSGLVPTVVMAIAMACYFGSWPGRAPCRTFFAGLRTGLTLALTGAIVGATHGLGVLVTKFSNELNISLMFAAIVLNGVFDVALYGIVEAIEYGLVFRKHIRSE